MNPCEVKEAFLAGVTLKDFREDRLARAEASEAREEQKREQRRILDEQYRCEEAAAEAKTKAQLEAFEKRLARDRSEASAAAKKALQREATRVLKKQEREKQKAVREALEQRARELKAAKALAQREREDAERARHVPYSCTTVMCFVVLAVAAFSSVLLPVVSSVAGLTVFVTFAVPFVLVVVFVVAALAWPASAFASPLVTVVLLCPSGLPSEW